jgi:hypothetical protein
MILLFVKCVSRSCHGRRAAPVQKRAKESYLSLSRQRRLTTLKVRLSVALLLAFPVCAQADFLPPSNAPEPGSAAVAASQPSVSPLDAATLASISIGNKALAAAQHTGQFSAFSAQFLKYTAPDFTFNTLSRVALSRSRFLSAEGQLMAQTTAVAASTWDVTAAQRETIDGSADAIARCSMTYTATDPTGQFGAKGASHAFVSNADVWEHWIQTVPSGPWVMDDMEIQSARMTVDGKPYIERAPKVSAPAQPRKATPNRSSGRARRTIIFGSSNDSF